MTAIPPGSKRLSPGFYAHAGAMHVDLEEFILAAGGNPADPRDRETALRTIREFVGGEGIPLVEIREQ